MRCKGAVWGVGLMLVSLLAAASDSTTPKVAAPSPPAVVDLE
ncbi:TraB/GumN family protein, partial [Xanthomonas hortorum pv. vitians]|nr:TraB/GumN family protein [Xanthomonas hortorum pv. vitians]